MEPSFEWNGTFVLKVINNFLFFVRFLFIYFMTIFYDCFQIYMMYHILSFVLSNLANVSAFIFPSNLWRPLYSHKLDLSSIRRCLFYWMYNIKQKIDSTSIWLIRCFPVFFFGRWFDSKYWSSAINIELLEEILP